MSQDFPVRVPVDFDDALLALMNYAEHDMANKWDGEHAEEWMQIKDPLDKAQDKYQKIAQDW